jgi:hypothetical protein
MVPERMNGGEPELIVNGEEKSDRPGAFVK